MTTTIGVIFLQVLLCFAQQGIYQGQFPQQQSQGIYQGQFPQQYVEQYPEQDFNQRQFPQQQYGQAQFPQQQSQGIYQGQFPQQQYSQAQFPQQQYGQAQFPQQQYDQAQFLQASGQYPQQGLYQGQMPQLSDQYYAQQFQHYPEQQFSRIQFPQQPLVREQSQELPHQGYYQGFYPERAYNSQDQRQYPQQIESNRQLQRQLEQWTPKELCSHLLEHIFTSDGESFHHVIESLLSNAQVQINGRNISHTQQVHQLLNNIEFISTSVVAKIYNEESRLCALELVQIILPRNEECIVSLRPAVRLQFDEYDRIALMDSILKFDSQASQCFPLITALNEF